MIFFLILGQSQLPKFNVKAENTDNNMLQTSQQSSTPITPSIATQNLDYNQYHLYNQHQQNVSTAASSFLNGATLSSTTDSSILPNQDSTGGNSQAFDYSKSGYQ